MKISFPIGHYPIQELNRTINDTDFLSPLEFKVSNLILENVALSPKMPTEENRSVLSFHLKRHIIDSENNDLVRLEILYQYRLDIDDDKSPTEDELIEILNYSSQDFAFKWVDLVHGTRFQTHAKTQKHDEKQLKYDFEKAIDFWNDSIRHLPVDENGKPLDLD